jgi:hypothetical protein
VYHVLLDFEQARAVVRAQHEPHAIELSVIYVRHKVVHRPATATAATAPRRRRGPAAAHRRLLLLHLLRHASQELALEGEQLGRALLVYVRALQAGDIVVRIPARVKDDEVA